MMKESCPGTSLVKFHPVDKEEMPFEAIADGQTNANDGHQISNDPKSSPKVCSVQES